MTYNVFSGTLNPAQSRQLLRPATIFAIYQRLGWFISW